MEIQALQANNLPEQFLLVPFVELPDVLKALQDSIGKTLQGIVTPGLQKLEESDSWAGSLGQRLFSTQGRSLKAKDLCTSTFQLVLFYLQTLSLNSLYFKEAQIVPVKCFWAILSSWEPESSTETNLLENYWREEMKSSWAPGFKPGQQLRSNRLVLM